MTAKLDYRGERLSSKKTEKPHLFDVLMIQGLD